MFIAEFIKITINEIQKGNIKFEIDLYIAILILSIIYLTLRERTDIENRIKKILK